LRLFQPGALDVGVSGTVKFGNQTADELGFVCEAQGPNLGLEFSDNE